MRAVWEGAIRPNIMFMGDGSGLCAGIRPARRMVITIHIITLARCKNTESCNTPLARVRAKGLMFSIENKKRFAKGFRYLTKAGGTFRFVGN